MAGNRPGAKPFNGIVAVGIVPSIVGIDDPISQNGGVAIQQSGDGPVANIDT